MTLSVTSLVGGRCGDHMTVPYYFQDTYGEMDNNNKNLKGEKNTH